MSWVELRTIPDPRQRIFISLRIQAKRADKPPVARYNWKMLGQCEKFVAIKCSLSNDLGLKTSWRPWVELLAFVSTCTLDQLTLTVVPLTRWGISRTTRCAMKTIAAFREAILEAISRVYMTAATRYFHFALLTRSEKAEAPIIGRFQDRHIRLMGLALICKKSALCACYFYNIAFLFALLTYIYISSASSL